MRKVKVIDIESTYSRYKNFIMKYAPNLHKHFILEDHPILHKEYNLIMQHPHLDFNVILAIIQDPKTKQVFIIDIKGIEFLENDNDIYSIRVMESRRSVSLYENDVLLKRVYCHEEDTFSYKIGLGIALLRTIYKDAEDVNYLSKKLDYKEMAIYCVNKFFNFDKNELEHLDKKIANRKREDKLIKLN